MLISNEKKIAVYWRDDRLRLVSDPLVQQIAICIKLRIPTSGRTLLSDCLSALVDCLEDDASVKAVNLAVLMHTRSEDARVRIFALQCSVAMWQAHGTKLRGKSITFRYKVRHCLGLILVTLLL